MAEGKKIFNLYTDLIQMINGSNIHGVEIEPMSDEEAGQLFRWILEYVNDLHPTVPKNIKYAVAQVKKQLDDDLERWKKQCEVNKINGALGGRPKKPTETEQNRMGFSKTEQNQIKPKKPDKDKDKDKDKDINISIKEKECIKEKTPTSRFIPPTLEEIKAYCEERNNLVDVERFYDFYQSKGWMVGKNKMKDWKAAVRTWEKEAGFKMTEEDWAKDGIFFKKL